jgi:hypothetical protein
MAVFEGELKMNRERRLVTELDALQAEVDALKDLQAETAAELDALLPSIFPLFAKELLRKF